MQVEFYTSAANQCHVADFIEVQENKAKKKILRQIELIRKYGIRALNALDIKKIFGDVWELRIKINKIAYRFCFVIREGIFWFLHAFIKKTKKTPQKEKDIMKDRLFDLENRVLAFS